MVEEYVQLIQLNLIRVRIPGGKNYDEQKN